MPRVPPRSHKKKVSPITKNESASSLPTDTNNKKSHHKRPKSAVLHLEDGVDTSGVYPHFGHDDEDDDDDEGFEVDAFKYMHVALNDCHIIANDFRMLAHTVCLLNKYFIE